LNFIITTHHPLFYNVLFNSIGRIKKSEAKKYFYILSKNSNETLSIEEQGHDSPFAYHLLVKIKIAEALESNGLEKYHFNLFRSLLEKTANFLGYRNFKDCISENRREEFGRIINLYSHGKLSEIENSTVSDKDKELFKETFNKFIETFKYK